jgi:beta-phosphoglucomutase-like phosphatase (HAD superfamily)
MQALIIELDPLFLGGLALPAEVLAERLEKYGIADNDPYRFVRNIYGKPFTPALEKLLPENIDVAHVERRLAATYAALLQQNAQQSIDLLKQTLRPLAKQGVRFAIITRLRQAIVSELFASITDEPIAVFDPIPLATGLTPDTLQAAVIALGYSVRQCFGLFACGASVRSAVRIGLRAIAVPDPMVSFENCAGADLVADHLGKTLTNKLLAKVRKV